MQSVERAWAEVRPAIPKGGDPRKESEALFRGYLQGRSHHLRNRITLINQGLVIRVAKRYQARCSTDLEDLVQLGNIGLMKAVEKFDPGKGVAFSSFAVPYIEGEMQHYQRDRRSLAKIPRRWQEASDSVRSIQQRLLKAGREVPLEAIAKDQGIEVAQWKEIEQATKSQIFCSLDEDAHEVAAHPSLGLEEREQMEAQEDAALSGLQKLPELERACLIERYWGELSDEVIARRHGLTLAVAKATIARGLQYLKEVQSC